MLEDEIPGTAQSVTLMLKCSREMQHFTEALSGLDGGFGDIRLDHVRPLHLPIFTSLFFWTNIVVKIIQTFFLNVLKSGVCESVTLRKTRL